MQSNPFKQQILQKLSFIEKQKQHIPPSYMLNLPQAPSQFSLYPAKGEDFIRNVKINTFYKILTPQYMNLNWSQPYYNNMHPIVAVACFEHPQDKYCSVSAKIIAWIESGGARCIPLKTTLSCDKIEKIISNSHALIVPSVQNLEKVRQLVININQIFKKETWEKYPALFLGNSALEFLKIKENLLDLQICDTYEDPVQTYIDHNNLLFENLELNLRMNIQNRKKVKIYAKNRISYSEIIDKIKNQRLAPVGICRHKTGKDTIFALQNQQKSIFYLFAHPQIEGDQQNIELFHVCISNFLNLARKDKKTVQEKSLIGTHKLVVGTNQFSAYYRIGI